jgi:hypothetical protein
MSNVPSEPRSNWTLRLISPKFNDELYLWMSTIPLLCGVIQFIVSFCYYLRFIGLFFVGGSGKGGIAALMLVILTLLVTIGLFVAFMGGFAYGIVSVGMLYEHAPWIVYLWLTIMVVGSIFKNTHKVKTIGDNEEKYALTNVYFWGMLVTAFMVFIIANDVFTKGLVETGGGNWLFIPFGLLACFISLFHCVVKPAITSLIVLYIFFFVKASDEHQGIQNQAIQSLEKQRNVLSVVGCIALGTAIVLFVVLYSPDKTLDSDLVSGEGIAPLPTSSNLKNQTKSIVSSAKKETYKNGINPKTIISSNKNRYSEIAPKNWNQVYMIPGPKFSFNKLNISLSYQQLINAARRGGKEAKIQVAILYMYGEGVKQDFDKAIYWFKESAKDKHPQGQKMLAYSYFGTTDKRQNHIAFKYFKAAAQQGDLEAQSWTSRLYHNGDGVKKDTKKANYWNKKAVDQEMQMLWGG